LGGGISGRSEVYGFLMFRTYKGSALDLEIYQGKAAIDYEIEVLTDSGGAFDFSVYASLTFKVFYRKHGDLILTVVPTTSSNVLILDLTIAQTAALQTREYFYECYGITTGGEEELIIFRIFKVV